MRECLLIESDDGCIARSTEERTIAGGEKPANQRPNRRITASSRDFVPLLVSCEPPRERLVPKRYQNAIGDSRLWLVRSIKFDMNIRAFHNSMVDLLPRLKTQESHHGISGRPIRP